MKKPNFLYQILIAVALCGFMYCANDGASKNDGVSKDAQGYDSTTTNEDSINAAHHVDPSNAYPQPPVTGSNQDSSRIKDTVNRPGY
jgi:hypothetical protein